MLDVSRPLRCRETSGTSYPAMRRLITEKLIPELYRYGNLKTCSILLALISSPAMRSAHTSLSSMAALNSFLFVAGIPLTKYRSGDHIKKN